MLITTRKAAFGVHLLISLAILVGLLTIIFFVWYPYDLIYAGGLEGLKILMGVDLVLGPLLTFIVFAPNKKGLKFDLTMIGLIQFFCLCYGMWMVYSQRPLVQVLIDDGVHLLSASDIQQHNVDIKKLLGNTPKNVMMDMPDDRNSWATVKLSTEFADNKPFALRDDLYLPVAKLSRQQYSDRLKVILELSGNAALQKLNSSAESCTWIPIISVHVSGYACHSFDNGIERLSDKKL